MNGYKTFSEFLEQRQAACHSAPRPPRDGREFEVAASPTHYDLNQTDAGGGEGQFEVRSIFGNPFKSVFKAVNPARPVSPSNSRLLASPFRKKRLKSQVVGR